MTMQLILGADVVKIEHPQYGDDTRSFDFIYTRCQYIFYYINRGKRSVALDLKKDVDFVKELIE